VTLATARTVRLDLAYDGTCYHGWQVQPNATTVQGCLLEAAGRVTGEAVRVTGASRTDAGVHALGQVASLQTASTLGVPALQAALNALLPRDIRVRSATEASATFDARRSARGKRYVYLVDNDAVAAPLALRYAWHVREPLDAEAMAEALRTLLGRHDFSAFCASAGRDREPTCMLRAVRVLRVRRFLVVLLSADSFLHHMARNIVGSALEVGRGRRDPGWLRTVMESHDRTRAGMTAPAHGLCLLRVMYPRGRRGHQDIQ